MDVASGAKFATDGIASLASLLMDQSGNAVLEKIKKAQQDKRFKKREVDFFKRRFSDVRDQDELRVILDFLDGNVARSYLWYSHEDDISIEQKEAVWIAFQEYNKKERGDTYVPSNYKDKLIECVNFHNQQVTEFILSPENRLVIKAIQNTQQNMEKSQQVAISTLDTNTTLSNQEDELNFYVHQLESLIASLRIVLKSKQTHLILTLLTLSSGLVLLIVLFYLRDSKGVDISLNYIVIATGICMLLFPIGLSIRKMIVNIDLLENKILEYTDALWQLHFRCYKEVLESIKKI